MAFQRRTVINKIIITVYGNPVSKKAHRSYYNKRIGRISTYSDAKQVNWEALIKLIASQHRPEKLLNCPLSVDATFYLLKPRSKPKKCLYPDTKPDHDNLEKALYDALEGIVYVNDSRIVDKKFKKRWGDPPRVEVIIMRKE